MRHCDRNRSAVDGHGRGAGAGTTTGTGTGTATGAGTGTGTGATPGAGVGTGNGVVDPNIATANADLIGTPAELVQTRDGDNKAFGFVAVLLLLALVLLPGMYVAYHRRAAASTKASL